MVNHAGSLTLSPLDESDVLSIVAIERLSSRKPWTAEIFGAELRLQFSRIFVARADALIGSGVRRLPTTADPQPDRHLTPIHGYLCRWLVARELQILNVAVHPDWRRRAIGRRLLEHALGDARGRGADAATLEVGRGNVAARALYESLGFRPSGSRPNYYGPGEDALLMELRWGADGG